MCLGTDRILLGTVVSLRASSSIWASETSLARTRERAAKPRVGELARRLNSSPLSYTKSRK